MYKVVWEQCLLLSHWPGNVANSNTQIGAVKMATLFIELRASSHELGRLSSYYTICAHAHIC